ncbi:hypothetical protein J6590_101075 [Homalodisca vitripennis]|nr:hypothetical protein J6590_101075 [Homalodisca vitripennis]
MAIDVRNPILRVTTWRGAAQHGGLVLEWKGFIFSYKHWKPRLERFGIYLKRYSITFKSRPALDLAVDPNDHKSVPMSRVYEQHAKLEALGIYLKRYIGITMQGRSALDLAVDPNDRLSLLVSRLYQ